MRVNFHGLLRLFKRETQPQIWETLQYQLANSLLQDPQGERADNVEQAIHHYQQALEVHTRQAFPQDWALAQHNLGAAYDENRFSEARHALEIAHQAVEALRGEL
jgi:hypothetical protein